MSAYTRLFHAMLPLVLLLELPMYALLAPQDRRGRVLLAALAGNALSYPLLWFGWVRVLSPHLAVLSGEASAVLIEALLLALVGVRPLRAVSTAALVNAYSWAVGEWIFRLVLPRVAP